jgi:dihydroorotate dehydrogenase subfamily 1
MNLNVEFDGLKLENPLMPASGPLSGDLEKLRFMQDQGVGAVVTKTISSRGAKVPRPCIYGDKYFVMNSELWSEHPKEVWLNEILPKYDKSDGRPLIISVGYTKEDVAMLIPLLEPFADAFEVSTHYVGKELSFIQETVRTIRGLTNKPVYMKISPNMDDPIAFAEAVRKAGASGIAAINTLGPTLKIDINSRKIVYGGENGFVWTSGPAIKNLALATVYKIKQAMPDFTVIGIGGIATADDVIEFLLAGANGVQMLSAALLKGKNLYSKVIENLPIALEKYGFSSIQDVVDTSLSRSISYEPIVPTVDIDTCVKCMLCEKICPYFAITIDEYPIIKQTKCFGCHLCVSKCPTKSLEVE